MTQLTVRDLGRIGYQAALDEQLRLVARAKTREADEPTLLLLEHDPPVITVGLRGENEDILQSREKIAAMGVEVFESSRGGQVTYHGPGQLVGYGIIDVKRLGRGVRHHVEHLEEAILRTLRDYGIDAARLDGFTGVWTADGSQKLAAIGVAVDHWVTYHGFALNMNTNMTHFDLIVPCGIRDRGVTSMAELLGRDIDLDDVKYRIASHLAKIYDMTL
ncbi:MAG: lipoyl(octanoyl) transferase LipB [Phycisphaerales bacterium]|jgi:lipoate-protein ligase B|nr:lipoyl(octanoyl) transferase LipB [Phycisphaerales bacterium]MBT7170499.1 lipoyl(octanoyl) transferase LipB [Phycisphaerales bacterium]